MSVSFNSMRDGMHYNTTMSSTTAGKVSKQRNQLIGLCHDVSGRPLHWPRNCKCAVKSFLCVSIIRAVLRTFKQGHNKDLLLYSDS
jgi:hypothetical protein